MIFVPYAKVNGDYDGYTKMMGDAIVKLGEIWSLSANLSTNDWNEHTLSLKSNVFFVSEITGIGTTVKGIHTFPNPVDAVKSAQCVYIGGGNSFVLLKTLYEKNLIDVLRKRVLEDGMPYMGSSAGSNVATRSIQTSNDMPITYPPT